MQQQVITFCYRKIIDVNSSGIWEKLVYEDTYTEFLLQVQNYDREKKYSSYSQLIRYVPDAGKLSFLVSSACIGYLQQLNEKIPDIADIMGRQFLQFKSFHFEIINSDTQNKSVHQVAINFYSEALLWHHTVANYLLVSELTDENIHLTNMVQLIPFLSIHSLKNVPE